MSAAGLAQAPLFRRRRIIASHADYKRSDFVFNRTQSREMKNAQWEDRIKPLKSWSEIGTYYGIAVVATAVTAFFIGFECSIAALEAAIDAGGRVDRVDRGHVAE